MIYDLLPYAIGLFLSFFAVLHLVRREAAEAEAQFEAERLPKPPPTAPPEAPKSPVEAPSTPEPAHSPSTVPESEVLRWDTPKEAFHSTRVICDEIGLNLPQKNTLCACIYQESRFLTNPKPNENRDPKTGEVWSTDFGIVQINDYWNIGPGKPFPSVEYVLANPEECVRWMAGIYKRTSGLQPWSSWTSGAYRVWLNEDSPMWRLR